MLRTRYEDYTGLTGKLPFYYQPLLLRNTNNISPAANWHENLELQLCLSGTGYVLIDGEQYSISEGDIVVVNSGVIHYTGTNSEIKYACLIVDSSFCRHIEIDHTKLRFETLFSDAVLKSLFTELTSVYSAENDLCRTAKLYDILLNILIKLRSDHTVSDNLQLVMNSDYEIVRNAIKYIRQNYNQKLTLDGIAKQVYTDKYRLSHSFKLVTGQTVVHYINSYKCRKAAEMIADGMTVNEAAHECGFTNMSYFTKTFKKFIAVLPRNIINRK